MKKIIICLCSALTLPLIIFFGSFSLISGERNYSSDDFISYWFYTPEYLKQIPEIAAEANYNYYYDLDNQQTIFVIRWSHVEDITIAKRQLLDFLMQSGSSVENDCLWDNENSQGHPDSFQRYCVSQKGNVLELEYVDRVK